MENMLITSLYYVIGLIGLTLIGMGAAVYFSSLKVTLVEQEVYAEERVQQPAGNSKLI
ncbi:hypothetical protein ACFFJY_01345 [Fictibacillus aquaticus]|uniref:hypothetical protein n=1 Tax=Fictibacillus aquaticus TaxID=2021314 RepID=UPI0013FDF1B9|nr:hypothetical protein [Fictibacillus aquaticus]